ncbi:hypothetical protein [Caulobacter sp. 17J65-9]|uniref:hypothetical protein n=1 Tax=Caulobacter sp. 17J65-9 TaxID=2709382 RepID=UPI0013CA2AE0|nr:hypothetical protein [Caulobacter sp. 17J65-9]NEX93643.1 hypothetical protein [Caulobacter sp. 17J65-9]
MRPITLSDKLQMIRDRYYLLVGPLVLLLAFGLGNSPVLAWTAGLILAAATVLKFTQRR